MKRLLPALSLLLLPWISLLCTSCQHAPQPGYADSAPIVARRQALCDELLRMLPKEQQALPEAREEARWLADTAYKAAVGIATINDPCLPGWLNNRLVNSGFNLQERGLCWHYQQDMYRELRRRPLHHFQVGCCVRDAGRGSEHNCVYLCPTEQAWPHVVILDAWRYNGRLRVLYEKDFIDDDWEDAVDITRFLSHIYTEGHRYPIEHWAQVKSGKGWKDYVPSWSPEGSSSRQGLIMQKNMYEGVRARHGKLTNY